MHATATSMRDNFRKHRVETHNGQFTHLRSQLDAMVDGCLAAAQAHCQCLGRCCDSNTRQARGHCALHALGGTVGRSMMLRSREACWECAHRHTIGPLTRCKHITSTALRTSQRRKDIWSVSVSESLASNTAAHDGGRTTQGITSQASCHRLCSTTV